ncbi:MAG: hypothetical protein ACD_62C00330G0005 [uncultured bacterium]|nr:MAG: hypothetical protein ACD_62C00330G0005 [uncultured bacterium]
MLIITNARILCPDRIIEKGTLCVDNSIIIEVSDQPQSKKHDPHAEIIDAQGGLVMPGLTNTHMHLYSTFARGMSLVGEAPANFVQILERLWWRLDKALTVEDVYLSAVIPLIECVRAGTTTIIDHHASPNFVSGSLSAIQKALSLIPVRASLCYEVSDRDGPEIAREGIEENINFVKAHTSDGMCKGLFGLHASLTLSDKTLADCAQAARNLGVGVHVHTAEDKADVIKAQKEHGVGVVERWENFGVLGSKTVLAHCVHISEHEMDLIARSKTNVVHNPESNMNNAVGCADVIKMLGKGCLVGLGTDGMTSDMFQEAKFAHLIRKHEVRDPRLGFMQAGELLFDNNYKILGNLFEGTLGRIQTGALADLIILGYDPPTPLTRDNFWGHFLYGMNSSLVNTTIINGRVLMKDRVIAGIDEHEICARSRELARKLWTRI